MINLKSASKFTSQMRKSFGHIPSESLPDFCVLALINQIEMFLKGKDYRLFYEFMDCLDESNSEKSDMEVK